MSHGTERSPKPEYIWKSKDQVQKIALDLRLQLEVDDRYILDLVDILSRIKRSYPKFKFKTVKDFRLPSDADARANPKAWKIYIREAVLNALNQYGDARARWTIAHELGH